MKLIGNAAVALIQQGEACWWVRPAPRTTTAPTKCEIERDSLSSSNPDGKHIPVCNDPNGEYRADQYTAEGINYCVDLEGEKIEGTIVFDYATSGRAQEC